MVKSTAKKSADWEEVRPECIAVLEELAKVDRSSLGSACKAIKAAEPRVSVNDFLVYVFFKKVVVNIFRLVQEKEALSKQASSLRDTVAQKVQLICTFLITCFRQKN